MHLQPYCSLAGAVLLLAATPVPAQTSSTRTTPLPASQKTDPTRRTSTARGPLPDPALLDGSAQPPEKKPDYGMLGEFELPGDENSKSDKVGGQSQPQGSPSGGGQQSSAQGGGGASNGAQQAGAQGGGGPTGGPQQASAQGGGAAGGAPPPNGQQAAQGGAAGGDSPVQNDPNAKADGAQVAGLSGDGDTSGQSGAGGADVPKPQQVALGDPTMRIKPAANAPGVVGGVTAGNTQQMESRVGGGMGSGGSRDGKNSSEKGRVMPAGL